MVWKKKESFVQRSSYSRRFKIYYLLVELKINIVTRMQTMGHDHADNKKINNSENYHL
jgi:hypothetical protein